MHKIVAVLVVFLMAGPLFIGHIPLLPSGSYSGAETTGPPVQPGVVNDYNSWGANLTEKCQTTSAESQPLVPVAPDSNWNASFWVSTLTFEGQSIGPQVYQGFFVYPNGTFVAADDHQNNLSFSWLNTLSGVEKISLVGNSSAAYQTFTVTVAGIVVSQITVSYVETYQYCQPAGIEMGISGNTNWGPQGFGVVGIQFAHAPLVQIDDNAVFGNQSGVALEFDWPNSASYHPQFIQITNELLWTVNSSFTIDPITIENTNHNMFGRWDHHIFFSQDLWWYFYTHYSGGEWGEAMYYMSSTNATGNAWNSPTEIGLQYNDTVLFDVAVSGATIYYVAYAATFPGNSDDRFWWEYGTLESCGCISWTNSETAVTMSYHDSEVPPSIALDTSGNLWAVIPEQSSSTNNQTCPCYDAVYKLPSGSTTWSLENTFSTSATGNSPSSFPVPELVPLEKGGLSLVTCIYCDQGSNPTIYLNEYNGNSWGSQITIVSGSKFNYYEITSLENTTYIVYEDLSSGSMGVKSINYTYGAAGPRGISVVDPLSSADKIDSAITTDNFGNLFVTVADINNNSITVYRSPDGGSSWANFAVVTTSETNQVQNSLQVSQTTNYLGGIGWLQGSGGSFNLRFTTIPFVIPSASLTTSPVSSPGLSPYEDYFTQLSEYVSPGSGLLGISQADLSLPGRGMDLGITRVYAMPYAFDNGRPIGYDNYTLANLGLGWQLDFPWLGRNYVHLQDGEVYPYNWTGSTFVNHRGTNFELVANSDGSYDLYSVSGTDYHFNSQKQLSTITDSTKNNTATFSYGSNGEISQITDTIGRVISFSYNNQQQVSSIGSAGITWSYYYSGSNLVKVSDPLSRNTTFQYESSNNWLINAVIYPTGAKTTYSYGNASVGIDALSYYVTKQQAYSSPTTLVRTTNVTYVVYNGQVILSMEAYYDGSNNLQGYTKYSFSGGSSVRTEEDATGTVIRSYETDYDNLGRVNATKVYDSSGNLLATSSQSYDNWGNVIFSQDLDGVKTWYSYANANPTNDFVGASGFTNSFYSNSGISPYIHDLPVGKAMFQNGTGSLPIEAYYEYNSAGELLQQKQLYNNGTNIWLYTSYSYDKYGNQITSTDPKGRTSYFQFSPSYDNAYLTQISMMDNGQNVSSKYTYNFQTGWKLSEVDPNGYATNYTYDNLGRVTQIMYPAVNGVHATTTYSYNDSSNILTITDANGHVQKQYFDGLGRLTQVQILNGSAVYSTESYTYNWQDKVATHTTPAGYTTSYSYDVLGRVIKVTNPDGTTVTTSYDTQSSGSNGAFGNGAAGAFTVQAGYWYQLSQNENYTSLTIPSGSTLNTCGYIVRVSGTLTNDGQITDACDVPAGGTGGTATANSPGGSGGAGSSGIKCHSGQVGGASGHGAGAGGSGPDSSLGGNGGAGGDGGGCVDVYAALLVNSGTIQANGWPGNNGTKGGSLYYEGGGGGGGGSGGNGGAVFLEYDTLTGSGGKITSTGGVAGIGGSGAIHGSDISAGSHTGQNGGGPNGGAGGCGTSHSCVNGSPGGTNGGGGSGGWYINFVAGSGGNGGNGQAGASGTITQKQLSTTPSTPNTETVTDENGHVTSYGYDWSNDLLWTAQYYNSTSFYLTSYSYDQAGNLLSMKQANGQITSYQYDDLNRVIQTNYPDGSKSTRSYDSVGNVISETSPNSTTVQYSYDALNRLLKTSYPNGKYVSYTYDADGNRLTMDSPSGNAYYSYNARDWLTNQTEVIDGSPLTILYSYDNVGNVASMTYPDGSRLLLTYDFLNRATKVGNYANFTYTLDSEVASIGYPNNNVKTSYYYNNMDRATQISSKHGTTVIMNLTYSYDPAGNVIQIGNEKYTYDALNRLISANTTLGYSTYSYDPVGNIQSITQSGVKTSYNYSSYNRLTQVGNVNYTYDPNGNMIKQVNGSTTWQYNYDNENRLINVLKNGVTVQTNTYDGDGKRVMQTTSGSSIIYAYDGLNMIYEKNLTSGLVTDRYYANGLQIAKNMSGVGSFYFVSDALGSIRLTTSSSGATTFSSDYLPFGKNYNIQGAFEEMMYTDKAYDSATGLYYFGARFYNSAIQRFLSEDSDTGSLNVPLSLNRYIYANDNPMSMNDATGHMAAYWSGNGIVSVPMVSRSPSDTSSFALAPSQPPPAPAPSSAQNPPRNYNYKNGNFMQGLQNGETNGGNGEGSETQSTAAPKLEFRKWLIQDWIQDPAHVLEVGLDLVAVIAALIMIPSGALFGILDGIVTASILTQFTVAIASGNPIQAMWSMVPVLGWILGQWVAQISFTTMLSIGISVVGNISLGVVSGGSWILVRLGYASAIIGSIALSLYGEISMEYAQYKSS